MLGVFLLWMGALTWLVGVLLSGFRGAAVWSMAALANGIASLLFSWLLTTCT